jgi:hypothetical protein
MSQYYLSNDLQKVYGSYEDSNYYIKILKLLVITSSMAAEVMNEWSYTSAPLLCLYGMGKENFTIFSNNVIKAGMCTTKLISQHT